MDKLLTYDGYDQHGPHIFPIELGGGNRHIKLATELHPKIAEYMAKAKPIPGKSQLLIDALGTGEWWGSNRNGDYFPHDQLSHTGSDYGYETFMHYAYPYKHHVNKDPARAYGDKVLLSAYHPGMHRVQLIVVVHNSKCDDILSRIDEGEYPDVSMGCRVPYDVCSICGNRAKNRSQYCIDLRNRMNRILPDGRKVMAINYRPKFFDISFVLIGAEKASKVLLKVAQERSYQTVSSAELGEKYYSKKAFSIPKKAEEKKGTITKKVPMEVKNIEPVITNAPDIKAREQRLPPAVMNALADFPLGEIFSTLAFLGIDPKPEEFQQIILIKSGQKKLATELLSKNQVFDEYIGSIPKNASAIIPIKIENINEKIAYLLRPHIAERSCFNPFLVSRLNKYAQDDSPWYPSPKASILASLPLAAALVGLYKYIKIKSPEASMTNFEKAISRHPWLLGLLLAAGVGTVAGGVNLLKPRPFTTEGNLDTLFGTGYNPHSKTASKKILIPLAMAPLAYMYSGVQKARVSRGEQLGRFDRFIAERPDLAAIASILATPVALSKGKALARFVKKGSIHGDFGLFALASGSKLMPAALIGAMVDATIAKQIGKIIEKRRKHGNA